MGKVVTMAALASLWAGAALADEAAMEKWVPGILSEDEAREGFFPLFNGENLDGWWIRGENKRAFAVEEGALKITGEDGGDWIFSDRDYENFVVRFEYRLPPEGGNSGFAIRATREASPAYSGMEFQIAAPSAPGLRSAGALVGSVAPAVAADKPAGEWNEVEIRAEGPHLRATMNGQVLYEIDLSTYASPDTEHAPLAARAKRGFFAIQDFGGPVWFRKIRLKPLPGGEGWSRLFDGESLQGWKKIGDAKWEIAAGVLRGEGDGMTTNSGLRTTRSFENFELRLAARMGRAAVGGIFLRGSGKEAWPRTYTVSLNNHDHARYTGGILAQAPARELRAADGAWFHLHIRAAGANIQVAVNGKTVVDYISTRHERCPRGWIMLQSHDPKSVVEYRDIEIREV